MSAFGNQEKDNIYQAIKDFISNSTLKTSETMEELMDVVSYAVKKGLEVIEDKQED